jgi:hypothetical protein
MAYVSPDRFSPYPRTCDVCGQLRSIATMRKLDGQTWVCDKHTGERTAIMLDLLNAHARPPQTWPNKDPKPQNPIYPNAFEADEANTLNFLAQQVFNRARYEYITSGDGSPGAVDIVPTMGWAARYAYKLIAQGARPTRMIEQAKSILLSAADYLLTRQYGSATGLSPFSDAFTGGVLESGATEVVTGDTSAAGLALLYAYRVFGTGSYLTGARSAASYLRNVQAIGSDGVNFTSSDSAGTARLYTGAVASEVSTTFGIDPGETFYANHLFYPGDLIALELWKELTTTDGDQIIGATTAVNGFTTAPAQLMSECIADMRACWTNGIRDATGTVVVGFSATTPREYFNAYPLVKTGFAAGGTGRWEYQDGPAATGTMISAQNYAKALGSLYAYEGASTQVAAVSDWLRSFTSNADFETPDDTSASVLARTTTGDYDPTVCLSTLLQVRDPDDDYSAIAQNGSSVYDWGAFGVLSPLWASRNASSFQNNRWRPLNIVQRYQDGTASDGLYFDRVYLRGISGLSFQTGFLTYSTEFGTFDEIPSTPGTNLGYWIEAGLGTSTSAGRVTSTIDQTGSGWDMHAPVIPDSRPLAPQYLENRVNGQPSFYYDGSDEALAHYGGPFYVGPPLVVWPVTTPWLFDETAPHTIVAVVKPDNAEGGMIFAHRLYFSYQLWRVGGDPLKQRVARVTGGVANDLLYADNTSYVGQTLLIVCRWDGANAYITINGVPLTTYDFFAAGTPSTTLDPVLDAQAERVIYIGSSAADSVGFRGDICSLIALGGTSLPPSVPAYLAGKYGNAIPSMANDAVRAAQFGLSFREAH